MEAALTSGVITHIQRFSVHDGPGIRTTVFLKGCQMHCPWCHNPETYRRQPEIQVFPERCIGCRACAAACQHAGARIHRRRPTSITAIAAWPAASASKPATPNRWSGSARRARRNRSWPRCSPIVRSTSRRAGQRFPAASRWCRPSSPARSWNSADGKGIHTAIETNLAWPWHVVAPLVPLVDLFLVDIKLMDDAAHRAWTGVSNRQTLDNLRRLDASEQASGDPHAGGRRRQRSAGADRGDRRLSGHAAQRAAVRAAALPSAGHRKVRGPRAGRSRPEFRAPSAAELDALAANGRTAQLRRQGCRQTFTAFALSDAAMGARSDRPSAGRGTTMPAAVSGCQPAAERFS